MVWKVFMQYKCDRFLHTEPKAMFDKCKIFKNLTIGWKPPEVSWNSQMNRKPSNS